MNKNWKLMAKVMPKARNLGKLSRLFFAMLKPFQAKRLIKTRIILVPTKPVSSAKIAKIESPIVSGRKLNFCLECPSPTPDMPPEPILINA